MSFMDDYVDVAERERLFFERYPDGRIQVELEEVRRADGELCAWKARASVWRTPDDPVPVVDYAVEPVPGATQFTKDSEAMNASTSAVGRAIVLAGFPTKKIASADEVRNRSGEADVVAAAPASPGNPVEKARAAQEIAKAARAPQDDGKPENVYIPFGKHKGSTLGQVPAGYLEWLVGNYEPKTPEQRRLVAAASVLIGADQPQLGSGVVDDDIPFAPSVL